MSREQVSYHELATVIRECAGVTVDAETMSRQPELTFADLGVESLGLMGVVAALENRHGIRLGAGAEECHRPEQLRDLVARAIEKEGSNAGTH